MARLSSALLFASVVLSAAPTAQAWEFPGYQGWCEVLGLCGPQTIEIDCYVCAQNNPPGFHCQSYTFLPDRGFDWLALVRFSGVYDPETDLVSFGGNPATCLESDSPITGQPQRCNNLVWLSPHQPLSEAPDRAIPLADLGDQCASGFPLLGGNTRISQGWVDRYVPGGESVVRNPGPVGVGVREFPPVVQAVIPFLLFITLLVTAFMAARIVIRAFAGLGRVGRSVAYSVRRRGRSIVGTAGDWFPSGGGDWGDSLDRWEERLEDRRREREFTQRENW